MRNDFKQWPEIVFIDGTYKLTNNNLTTMILLVEDGNGRGQVAGVGLLATEERDVLTWMLEVFKKGNGEACNKIKCFMSDKDLTERNVLKELFPVVPTYICIFHTLKTFKKIINSSSMNLTSDEKITAATILEKLVYSPSEEIYNKLYNQFCQIGSLQLVEYFNKNWHNIKEDWSMYSLIKHNLGNTTNNRIESVNGKIKQVVEKNSPMTIMIKDFFEWYTSHKNESFNRTARQFLKKPNFKFDVDSCIQKYVESLTQYASDIVQKEIKASNTVSFNYINDITQVCYADNLIVTTTCQCIVQASLLPCRHIFALRKYFQFPLFDKCLCNERWSKGNLLIALNFPNVSNDDKTPDNIVFSVTSKKKKIKKKSTLLINEKRKIIQAKCSKLTHIISMSSGKEFQKKSKILDDLIEKFSENVPVKIISKESDDTFETSFKNLSVNESTEFEHVTTKKNLQEIKTLSKIKITGRPNGFLKTIVCLKKKIKVEACTRRNISYPLIIIKRNDLKRVEKKKF